MQRSGGEVSKRNLKRKKAILDAAFLLTAFLTIISNAAAQTPQLIKAKFAVAAALGSDAPIGAPRRSDRRIVVSLVDRKLALVEDGRVLKVYRVAVGTPDMPTPEGEFRIINRVKDPSWYGGSISPGTVIPAGPANPLGTRWIGLNQKGYGIHGTNAPKSIGKRASHGCIRMRKADLEELFEIVRVGDTVELVGRRSAELAQIFGVPEAAPEPQPAPAAAPVVVASLLPNL